MGLDIQKNIGYHNTTKSVGRKIKYIVLHYTAGTSSKAGTAWNTATWFKNTNAGGSADYIVDDSSIVQYTPDPLNYYCWSVGGNRYSEKYTTLSGKLYNICTNKNSVSIEICSNKTNKSSLGSLDSDWYFTEAALEKARQLTKYLMDRFNIPIQNVVMHHQVTGKPCPAPWTIAETRLVGYTNFINSLRQKEEPKPDRINTTCKIAVNGKVQEYASINVKGNNYVKAREFLETLGYQVGFDTNKKRVKIDNRLVLDIPTIIENNISYIHLRETINFLNKYDTWKYVQDKTIRYDEDTKVIVIS